MYPAVLIGFLLSVLAITITYWSQRNRKVNDHFSLRSIAVLPFKTIGTGSEADVIGLGMADAIIMRLSQHARPTVLPTSSVFKYTSREVSALSVGKELGVDAVLDGTVQRYGDRVRVTAQLINLSDDRTVWSGKFEEDYLSVFTLQDSISAQLSIALQSQISGGGPKRNVYSPQDPEANQAYLMGLYFWSRRTRENLPKAVGYFEQAVKKDPRFALAYAGLADCYYLSSQASYAMLTADESLKRADVAATRALELDETIAEAHVVKAGVWFNKLKYSDADREFRRALELKPSNVTEGIELPFLILHHVLLECL